MWLEILTAVALLLVLEGLLPFISPGSYRRGMSQLLELTDRQLRNIGFWSMVAGAGLLYWIR